MSRVKKVLTGPVDRAGAEEAFAQFATAAAKEKQITGKMDVEITRIRSKYDEELSALKEQKEEAFEKLQSYAENNRQDFGSKKSLEFTHGVLGFRTGTPKLKTLRGYTWPSVTNLLKEFLPSYVRSIEEPAKDRLLSDRDDPNVKANLAKVGLLVDQDEAFYVEPKQELNAE